MDTVPEDLLGSVSRETLARLSILVEELTRWQRIKNLVGPDTLDQVWTRHIADSLQLLELGDNGQRWVDLGSGAGFPGLVVAIAGSIRPGFHVDLVESNSRKCAFLRHAARSTRAPVRVHEGRIETILPRLQGTIDVVTARALAPLSQLLAWTAPLIERGAVGLFPKGRDVDAELTAARESWTFAADLVQSRTHGDGRIVRITRINSAGSHDEPA